MADAVLRKLFCNTGHSNTALHSLHSTYLGTCKIELATSSCQAFDTLSVVSIL